MTALLPPHVQALIDALPDGKWEGNEFVAFCPAHDDAPTPSLKIYETEQPGNWYPRCYGGCKPADILHAKGFTQDTWWPRARNNGNGKLPDDWSERVEYLYAKPDAPTKRLELASKLGVSVQSLEALRIGWYPGNNERPPWWAFPERDATGKAIGINRRFGDGQKKRQEGGSAGLTFTPGWDQQPGPALIVEGGSDVAAGLTMGLAIIGRPSADGGKRLLAELLRQIPSDREIIVLGENDQKADGKWPGRTGAVSVSTYVAKRLKRPVRWALPPEGYKDLRSCLIANGTDGQAFLASLQFPEMPVGPVDKCDTEDDGRHEIEVTHDEHEVISGAAAAIATHPEVYCRGGEIVSVRWEDGKQAGIERPEPSPRIRRYSASSIREVISSRARFVKHSKSEDGEESTSRVSMPKYIPAALIDRGFYDDMRHLSGVVTAPVLRPNGSLLTTPGYDPVTGLLYHQIGDVYVPESPTKYDAMQAAESVLETVADFPFSSDAHCAAWLSFVLSIVGRPAYGGPTPLFLADANTPGTGKTLALEAGCYIATGRLLPRTSFQADDSEMRKAITAVALAGDACVLLDNLDVPLGGAALDAALTSTIWRDRVLGVSRMFEGPLLAVWCASGNNVSVRGDTARRVVHIRLDSDLERPEERSGFRHDDLMAWVRRERHRLVGDALTILRGFIVAGRPQAGLKPWGSFGEWSALIRASIVWLGLPDPAETKRELLESSDREGPMLQAILAGLKRLDPMAYGVTAAQIVEAINAQPQDYTGLRDALAELCRVPHLKLEASKIGYRLRKYVKRVCGDLCLMTAPNSDKVTLWRAERVKVAGDGGHTGDVQHPLRERVTQGVLGV